MIITISGLPGSGKSSIATRLARELGWEKFNMGGLRRKLAKERGLTLQEEQAIAEKDPEMDKLLDDKVTEMANQDNILIESRTAYHFIPKSYKIFLSVDPVEGARRIFNDIKKNNDRNEGNHLTTAEEVVKVNQVRMASDRKRYKQYYNIDVFDENNFNFVLDTTKISIDEVFSKVRTVVSEQLKKNKS